MRNKPHSNALESKQSGQQTNRGPKAVHDSCEKGLISHALRTQMGVRNAIHWAWLICIQSRSIVDQKLFTKGQQTAAGRGLRIRKHFRQFSLAELGIDGLAGGKPP